MKQAAAPRWVLLIVAVSIGLVGYYGPWVPNRAAGLVVLGLDLAEYVKFLPQVRSGQIAFPRELFYLPLLTASITAALLAGRRGIPAWLRLLCALMAAPLALAMLPPAWSPSALTTPEYRVQAVAIFLCLAAIPGVLVTRFLADRPVLIATAALCLVAAALPAWAFFWVKPPIEGLYNHHLAVGWGFWLCLAGFGAATAISATSTLQKA